LYSQKKRLTREGKAPIRGSDGLPTNGFYVVGRHPIPVIVAEMSPQIIDDRGDLIVVHHRSERWHSALSVDDDVDGISARFEISVARE
jgi:hypothetical protein